jgi:micrococcal nuclease
MTKRPQPQKQSTMLQWLTVGAAGLLLLCIACGVIGMLAGGSDDQVASTPPTETAAPTALPTAAPTIAPPTSPPEPAPAPAPTEVPPPEPPPEPTEAPPTAAPPEPTAAPPTAAPTAAPQAIAAPELERESAQVVRVVDGDTLKVMLNGQEQTVRLIGIDTPESVHPRQPVECFGIEASNKAKELASDQPVQLAADPTQDSVDRYGRLLRYVYLPDGALLNWELIYQGYAFEYTYNVPYFYQSEFQQAERDAREQQRGLWAPATCNGESKPADQPAPPAEPTPAPPPTEVPPPPPPAAGNCDPAYANVCIPPPPPDLNCPAIREQYGCDIQVISWPDPHGIDRDGNGLGCEC